MVHYFTANPAQQIALEPHKCGDIRLERVAHKTTSCIRSLTIGIYACDAFMVKFIEGNGGGREVILYMKVNVCTSFYML